MHAIKKLIRAERRTFHTRKKLWSAQECHTLIALAFFPQRLYQPRFTACALINHSSPAKHRRNARCLTSGIYARCRGAAQTRKQRSRDVHTRIHSRKRKNGNSTRQKRSRALSRNSRSSLPQNGKPGTRTTIYCARAVKTPARLNSISTEH